MTTAFVYAPALDHNEEGHPENNQRGPAVEEALKKHDVWEQLIHLQPREATYEELVAAHDYRVIDHVQEISLRGGGRIDQDTYVTAESYSLASLAAGSVIVTADAIMAGKAKNGFTLVRPPGHHAESQRPGGFCLFNNVAVGARHLQAKYPDINKVLILDFDVHHGNGTQDIFYHDHTVYFLSIQQCDGFIYPGSGTLGEIGLGNGKHYTLNVPLPAGVGNDGYAAIFAEIVAPAVRRFDPDFIIVSAGYDAHWVDPLASTLVSAEGFSRMSHTLVQLAEELCHGRILFVQEGGYVLPALAYGVLNTVYALQGEMMCLDPLGPNDQPETDITKLLADIKALHLIK